MTADHPTPTDAEGDLYDALNDTMALRCCDCPACNYYAPDYEQHKDEPCQTLLLVDRIAAVRAEAARAEAVAPVLAMAEKLAGHAERSAAENPPHHPRLLWSVAAQRIREAVGDDGALARIQAEAWPCANYTAPVTCLHAGTTTPCDWCREAGAGAEQRGAAQVKAAVESLIDQWPVGDNGQDYRRAVTQCAQAIRTAFADADTTAHDRAVAAEVERRLAQAYDDGYNDAVTMARCYGHTDHWPEDDEPRNPYRAAVVRQGGER